MENIIFQLYFDGAIVAEAKSIEDISDFLADYLQELRASSQVLSILVPRHVIRLFVCPIACPELEDVECL